MKTANISFEEHFQFAKEKLCIISASKASSASQTAQSAALSWAKEVFMFGVAEKHGEL
jgi:hypothetical protein